MVAGHFDEIRMAKAEVMSYNAHYVTVPVTMTFFLDPPYQHGLTFIPAWISDHMPIKVWGEITYPSLNFKGATVKFLGVDK